MKLGIGLSRYALQRGQSFGLHRLSGYCVSAGCVCCSLLGCSVPRYVLVSTYDVCQLADEVLLLRLPGACGLLLPLLVTR